MRQLLGHVQATIAVDFKVPWTMVQTSLATEETSEFDYGVSTYQPFRLSLKCRSCM